MSNLEKSLQLLDKFLAENDPATIEKIIKSVENSMSSDVPLLAYFEMVNSQLNPDNFLNFDNVDWNYTYTVKPAGKPKVESDILDSFSKSSDSVSYSMAA